MVVEENALYIIIWCWFLREKEKKFYYAQNIRFQDKNYTYVRSISFNIVFYLI